MKITRSALFFLVFLSFVKLITATAFSQPVPPFELTLEAEAMMVKTSGEARWSGWMFWEEGMIAQAVDFPQSGRHRFTLRAHGNFVEGEWSAAELRLDGVPQQMISIDSSDDADFSAEFFAPAGTHVVAIAYVNDFSNEFGDRNLWIDWLKIQYLPPTPPVISNIAIEQITASTATIKWQTNEASTSQVEYGPTNFYGLRSLPQQALTTEHAVTLTNLAANTIYHYRVKSTDATGDSVASGDATFTTRPHGNVAFANVQSVFDDNCVRCHQGATAPAGLVLTPGQAYANIVNVPSTESPSWQRVKSASRAASWLYEKITNAAPAVGSKMASLTPSEIELIGRWIDQGATAMPTPPYAELEFHTPILPNAEINIVYDIGVIVRGGLPPYQFTLVAGELPPGINLDLFNGHITGVSSVPGEYHFQIRVSDSQSPPATLTQAYRINVNNTGEHWQLPPGFTIEAVVTDLHLPVNIAFVPNAGPNPTDPYFYVTLLHGDIVMVQRNFQKQIYATNLLNYNPVGEFPGSGEMGVTGIVVDPESGDVFAAMVYDDNGDWRNRIVRFHSADGGHTAATQTTIMSGVAAAFSHQIQALTIGPDGKLYANLGDGWVPAAAPDLHDRRGKILRLNLDGSLPLDNPFPNTPIYATGLRNPFGAAWREEDGRLYLSDNGPEDNDRLIKVMPGGDFGWGLESQDLTKGAIYLWNPTVSPVAIDFLKFTAFPAEYRGNLFAALSGPPYWQGPTERGKKIQRFRLDANGNVLSDSLFLDYIGAGKATVIGLACGPDGLYFTDLYGENGFDELGQTHGNVYRIRWPSPDSTSPAIANVRSSKINSKRATISWQTDEAAISQVEYGLTTAYGKWAVQRNIFSTRHQITVTQLLPQTVYHFRVWNWDAANNSAVSQNFTFQTLVADSLAPVISAVRIDSISAHRALVIWQTNEPATSTVDYGRTLNYDLSRADTALVTTHRIWLLNLQDSTRYHLRLRSTDNNDNETRTSDLTFTTLPRQFERRLEAETMPIKTGGSESAPGWVLWDNGYVAENVKFPRAGLHRFTVRAYGRKAADEWSRLELRINQETRATIEVADSNYIELASTFYITAGLHEVAIAFINEAYDPPEHRYLGVDWLYIQDITTQQIHAEVGAKPAAVLPASFTLSSYPNPFFTTARIRFSLPQNAEVNLAVFDLTGREIITLLTGSHQAGLGEMHWNGKNRDGQFLRSGFYFLRLRYRTGNGNQWSQIIQRVVLMK